MSTGCIEVCGRTHGESALNGEGFGRSLSHLEPAAKMKPVRRAWKVGDFKVSVDDSQLLLSGCGKAQNETLEIPHCVGEVELCEEVEEDDVEERLKEMTSKIDGFMGRYNELCRHVPEGKLTTYFRWQKMLREQRFILDFRWDGVSRRLLLVQ